MPTPAPARWLPIVPLTFTLALAVIPLASHAQPADRHGGGFEDPDGYGGAGYGGAGYGGRSPSPAFLMTAHNQLVRFDDSGQHPIMDLPLAANGVVTEHEYSEVSVDPATGRWFMTRQRIGSNGTSDGSWHILYGDRDHLIADVSGDPACGTTEGTCFEHPLAFTVDGAGILTTSSTRHGTTIGRYRFGSAGRTQLVGRSVGTTLAISRRQDRAVYASRGGFTIIGWDRNGPITTSKKVKVRAPGALSAFSITADTIYYERETKGGRVEYERYSLATGKRAIIHRVIGSAPWPPVSTKARGTVLAYDCSSIDWPYRCDLVEFSGAQTRTAVRDIANLKDVTSDGHTLMATRAALDTPNQTDLVLIDVDTGADLAVYPGLVFPGLASGGVFAP
jgi:hypothetical protein